MSKPFSQTAMAMCLVWLSLSSLITGVANVPNTGGTSSRMSTADEFTIDSPSDLTFENGSLGKTIKWTPVGSSSGNYTVLRNATVYLTATWTGAPITVQLDHLYTDHRVTTLPIAFNFTCKVFNGTGQSVLDTVFVYIIADETAPIILAPDNFSYEAGSFGHYIRWNLTESNPDFYNITRISNETLYHNETILLNGTWTGNNISINVDGLNATHWYTYFLFVNDTLGHNATSVVNVTVYTDTTAPTATSPDEIQYEYGSKNHKLRWFAYDSNPNRYTIYVYVTDMDALYGDTNSSRFHSPANITQANWTFTEPKGAFIVVDVTDLFIGNYSYVLTLYDDFGLNTTDSVNVTVYMDLRAPVVAVSGNYTYEEGYSGYWINWSIDESNPRTFNLTRNNGTLQGGVWLGQNFTIDIDGLAVGDYLFNLTLIDFFNQTTKSLIDLRVTPDAHLPLVAHIMVIQSFLDAGMTNITFQAFAWDLNNIRNVTIVYGTDPTNDPASRAMKTISTGLYFAEVGAYPVATKVWYRVVAVDNSSVNNRYETEWASFVVVAMTQEEAPALLIGAVVFLGTLSLLVVMTIYFRTKTRG